MLVFDVLPFDNIFVQFLLNHFRSAEMKLEATVKQSWTFITLME